MTYRLINLRAWEAAALAEGRATALVRVCKPQPPEGPGGEMVDFGDGYWAMNDGDLSGEYRCPFGAPGDVILGREAWRRAYPKTSYSEGIVYRADASRSLGMDEYSQRHKWNPSITMPRHAIRARYTNSGVRCTRVQELTEQDAKDLGAVSRTYRDGRGFEPARIDYKTRFNSDHGPGAWAANPWVFIARMTK